MPSVRSRTIASGATSAVNSSAGDEREPEELPVRRPELGDEVADERGEREEPDRRDERHDEQR